MSNRSIQIIWNNKEFQKIKGKKIEELPKIKIMKMLMKKKKNRNK